MLQLILDNACIWFESLPECVNVWLAETLERILVFISLILNASVLVLFVKTWRLPQRRRKLLDEELLATLRKFIKEHSKTLTQKDLYRCGSACEEGQDSDDDASWLVPKPGVKARNASHSFNGIGQQELRCVSGDCAICMQQYSAGDEITWSSNPDCVHCYHTKCLRTWISPWQTQNQRCPYCRQPYCTAP